MKRIKDTFTENLQTVVSLADKHVLEIGCGNGAKSVGIAHICKKLTGIDPDENRIKEAYELNLPNTTFLVGDATNLKFEKDIFDITIFTLSFHHVAIDMMNKAIEEAVRVTKKSGYIVFLEPTENGSFFDAEIMFDASDGDERKEKQAAYRAMMSNKKLKLIKELEDETSFQIDSVEDFVNNLNPQQNIDNLEQFLSKNNYILEAKRRINVFGILSE